MNFFTLMIVAFGGTFAVVYLLSYVPLTKTVFGKLISPRLIACKFLAPFDVGITLFLIMGSWIGITVVVTGISMMMYNVLTGIGISLGVIFTKKVLVPRWQTMYMQELSNRKEVTIQGIIC